MKTTQKKIMNAFMTITNMQERKMDRDVLYKLFKLQKALSDNVEFQAREEQKIIAETGGTISVDGHINYDNEKKAGYIEFLKRRAELDNMECEIEIKAPIFKLSQLPVENIAELKALDDFIEIEEE